MPYNMPLMPSPRFSSYLSPPYHRILYPLKRELAAGAENPIYTRLSEIKRGGLLEGVHKAEISYDFLFRGPRTVFEGSLGVARGAVVSFLGCWRFMELLYVQSLIIAVVG